MRLTPTLLLVSWGISKVMFKKSYFFLSRHSRQMSSFRNSNKYPLNIHAQKAMAPMEYLARVPSRHHKPMVSAFNYWLKVPKEKLDNIEHLLQTLHVATLLIDDIQDGSALRYGAPATHEVFGVGLTLNAAGMTVLEVAKAMFELGHPMAPTIYLDRMIEMNYGQGIDLYWRDNYICPTEEEHLDMIKKKAASFFVMIVELLQLFSASTKDYTSLANNIGLYYCILDDYYNLFLPKGLRSFSDAKQDSASPPSCTDITECKFTLPIIHAMRFPDISGELFDILKQKTTDQDLKNRFVSLLKKHHSDEYTRDALRELESKIRAEIDQVGGNPMLTKLMDELNFKRPELE